MKDHLFDQERQQGHINNIFHLLPDEKALEATEIWKIAVNKPAWNKDIVVSKKKKPPDLSSELE